MLQEYVEIPADEVPIDIVWTTPGRYRGGIVETSFSRGIRGGAGGEVNYEADEGDAYSCVVDGGDKSTTYYRHTDFAGVDLSDGKGRTTGHFFDRVEGANFTKIADCEAPSSPWSFRRRSEGNTLRVSRLRSGSDTNFLRFEQGTSLRTYVRSAYGKKMTHGVDCRCTEKIREEDASYEYL